MFHDALTILDLEATGLRPEAGDRLTEIGLVRIEDGRVVARWDSLVNSGVRLTSSATAYTGITQSMLECAPSPSTVLAHALKFIGDSTVVAHGAQFDEALLRIECERAGLQARLSPFVCSLHIARRVYGHLREHSLGALAHSLRLGRGVGQHRAATDAETAAELVLRIGRDLSASRSSHPLSTGELRRLAQPLVAPLAPALCA
jgi:DNA polymerase-3 subunit epsilon